MPGSPRGWGDRPEHVSNEAEYERYVESYKRGEITSKELAIMRLRLGIQTKCHNFYPNNPDPLTTIKCQRPYLHMLDGNAYCYAMVDHGGGNFWEYMWLSETPYLFLMRDSPFGG